MNQSLLSFTVACCIALIDAPLVMAQISDHRTLLKHNASDVGDFDSRTTEPVTRAVPESVPQSLKQAFSQDFPMAGPRPSDQRLDPPRVYEAQKLFQTGIIELANKSFSKAIEYFQNAIIKSDSDPAFHWYLGETYQSTGQIELARSEFKRAKSMAANQPFMTRAVKARSQNWSFNRQIPDKVHPGKIDLELLILTDQI